MDYRKDVVRRGYDALSYLYRGDDENQSTTPPGLPSFKSECRPAAPS